MLSSTDPETIGRKHPAHGVPIDLGKPTIVFLTVCTKDRKPWLACDEAHDLLREVWRWFAVANHRTFVA
ncbi:MAG: hypothetical protein ABW214_07565 [Terrimicrobiaceae bacterium]